MEIRERGSWSTYQCSRVWTEIAKAAAESVCRNQFALQTAREYFNLDVIGWSGSDYDYDLRVAFEAEDSYAWEDELCKLAHIVSDLRVLVTYQGHRRRAEVILDELLTRHCNRVIRDCNCKWLFVFGPYYKNRSDCWAAYTCDPSGKRIPISDEPLRGGDMKD